MCVSEGLKTTFFPRERTLQFLKRYHDFTKRSFIFLKINSLEKNADVVHVDDKPVKNDTGEMSIGEDLKQKAWLEHYQRFLNTEFDWDPDHLSHEPPVEGPPIPISIYIVKKAISQMKAGKAMGSSGIVVEMTREAGDMGTSMIPDLAAAIICDGKVPSNWEQSFIVCPHSGNGNALHKGNYHGLKLTEQVMKILERIVDGSSDGRCQSMLPSLASSQAEAQQKQSLLSGSCKRNI